MDRSQPSGWGSRLPCHFELTELGRRSLLTKLADSQDENSEVWESLPGFQWYAPTIRAKAGTEVFCVHKDASNEYGRLPLLVTQTYGVGKVLFMGTDGAWRWRKGVEDKYHYRFWGQVVRWMAYQRNMAKGATMRLVLFARSAAVAPNRHAQRQCDGNQRRTARQRRRHRRTSSPLPAKPTPFALPRMGDEWGAFAAHFTAEEARQARNHAYLQANRRHARSLDVRPRCRRRTHWPRRPARRAGRNRQGHAWRSRRRS